MIAAGYTVLRGEEDESDLSIVIDGHAEPSGERKTPLLHLRSHRDPRDASDTSIYRYDREALVAALEKLDAPVRFTKLTDEETPESPPYVAYMEHHNAWTPAYKVDSPMWAWLFAQSRGDGVEEGA